MTFIYGSYLSYDTYLLCLFIYYCSYISLLCILLLFPLMYVWRPQGRIVIVLIELPSLNKELFVINHYNFLCIIVGFAITRWQISHVFSMWRLLIIWVQCIATTCKGWFKNNYGNYHLLNWFTDWLNRLVMFTKLI